MKFSFSAVWINNSQLVSFLAHRQSFRKLFWTNLKSVLSSETRNHSYSWTLYSSTTPTNNSHLNITSFSLPRFQRKLEKSLQLTCSNTPALYKTHFQSASIFDITKTYHNVPNEHPLILYLFDFTDNENSMKLHWLYNKISKTHHPTWQSSNHNASPASPWFRLSNCPIAKRCEQYLPFDHLVGILAAGTRNYRLQVCGTPWCYGCWMRGCPDETAQLVKQAKCKTVKHLHRLFS